MTDATFVWVLVGRTQHPATSLEVKGNETFVKWSSTGGTEWVDSTAVQAELGRRRGHTAPLQVVEPPKKKLKRTKAIAVTKDSHVNEPIASDEEGYDSEDDLPISKLKEITAAKKKAEEEREKAEKEVVAKAKERLSKEKAEEERLAREEAKKVYLAKERAARARAKAVPDANRKSPNKGKENELIAKEKELDPQVKVEKAAPKAIEEPQSTSPIQSINSPPPIQKQSSVSSVKKTQAEPPTQCSTSALSGKASSPATKVAGVKKNTNDATTEQKRQTNVAPTTRDRTAIISSPTAVPPSANKVKFAQESEGLLNNEKTGKMFVGGLETKKLESSPSQKQSTPPPPPFTEVNNNLTPTPAGNIDPGTRTAMVITPATRSSNAPAVGASSALLDGDEDEDDELEITGAPDNHDIRRFFERKKHPSKLARQLCVPEETRSACDKQPASSHKKQQATLLGESRKMPPPSWSTGKSSLPLLQKSTTSHVAAYASIVAASATTLTPTPTRTAAAARRTKTPPSSLTPRQSLYGGVMTTMASSSLHHTPTKTRGYASSSGSRAPAPKTKTLKQVYDKAYLEAQQFMEGLVGRPINNSVGRDDQEGGYICTQDQKRKGSFDKKSN